MGGRPLGYFLHATPEEAAERIREYVGSAPVREVHIDAPINGLSEDMIVGHVQTICTRLAPLLRDGPGLTA
jgi:hypothetical protein